MFGKEKWRNNIITTIIKQTQHLWDKYLIMSFQRTQEFIINQFEKIHGNTYDYSKVSYKTGNIPVIIICKRHGEFKQRPPAHRHGHGCKLCNNGNLIQKIGQNGFIDKLKKEQSEEFVKNLDFMDSEITDIRSKFKVKCRKTNTIFDTSVYQLLCGWCCVPCKLTKKAVAYAKRFLENAVKIHGNTYDYSKSIYTHNNRPVIIICKYHGEFKQKPAHHITYRSGCPVCCISKGESQIGMWLTQNNIKYIHQYKIKIDEYKHWFDFYIPTHNTIIEFQGAQHYRSVKRWGGIKAFKIRKQRDNIKREYCLKNNIIFLEIKFDQMKEIEKILENSLTNKTTSSNIDQTIVLEKINGCTKIASI